MNVIGARYHNMIAQIFLHKLEDWIWMTCGCQQDCAACHTAHEQFHIFPNRVFSRLGEENWPPRSYDLTPLDFVILNLVNFDVIVV